MPKKSPYQIRKLLAKNETERDELRKLLLDNFAQNYPQFVEGKEPLTDELIQELAAKGIPEADLREMAADGAMYSRTRDSFLYPPEVDLD